MGRQQPKTHELAKQQHLQSPNSRKPSSPTLGTKRTLQEEELIDAEKSNDATDDRSAAAAAARPRRRATNQHIFRYLQTRNPTKLEENDLKRALEASLEECPDFWPEDTASCSSSEQSNATSSTSSMGAHSLDGNCNNNRCNHNRCISHLATNGSSSKRRSKSMQHNHLNCSNPNSHHHHHHNNHSPHNHHTDNNHNHNQLNNNHHLSACCPLSSVHNRYKPVAKKNIYNEADFFHDGIMEYIEYELTAWSRKKHKNKH